jgi:endonuclease/exonuclease/phosphatase family metal-dependent hydrolase
MTWNAQTFFDAVDQDSEFDEFKIALGGKAGGKWNAAKYNERLDRLCEVILACGRRTGKESGAGPDIVVLEEIENAGVVRDIVNRLPQRSTYRNAAFVPPAAGSSFGSVVLSRYPVVSVSAHTVAGGETALRPLLEVTLQSGDERIVVFAVHWKSKLGDSAGMGDIRLEQETLLAERIAALSSPPKPAASVWIACGDFNQKRDEFTVMNAYPNCWDGWIARLDDGKVSGPRGSYCYRGNWETIDNIFVPNGCAGSSSWQLEDFEVVAESPFTDENGVPVRYESFSGKGYSDHLPLVMVLEKK